MASPNYSEILATTLHYYGDEIVDNVTNNNALLFSLKDRGNIKTVDGGDTIVQSLEYAENATYKRYSGWEQLDITPSDVITAANFDWKQVGISVSLSGLEQLKNSGKEKIFDLMETKIKNAKHTYDNNFSTDLYSDGTANGGKQIGGLQLVLSDDPTTGTVGGINRATWSFWQHQKRSCLTDGGSAASAANITANMNALWLKFATQKPGDYLIVADSNYFGFFETSLQAIQRITDPANKLAKAGFQTYMYKGSPVVFDGGLGGQCPANHMYFIGLDFIYLRPHKDRNMVPLDPDRYAVGQDGIVKLMGWAGNLTGSNFRRSGVLIA